MTSTIGLRITDCGLLDTGWIAFAERSWATPIRSQFVWGFEQKTIARMSLLKCRIVLPCAFLCALLEIVTLVGAEWSVDGEMPDLMITTGPRPAVGLRRRAQKALKAKGKVTSTFAS